MTMTSEQEQLLYPFAWYREKRETSPISFSEEYGSWSVFSYDEVQRVLSDADQFSSQIMGQAGSTPLEASIINSDPPRHRKLRSLVTQAFTPRTITQLVPRITKLVQEILDNVAAHGTMDIIDDLAYPLPVIVIAELLGVPAEDRAQFRSWSDKIVGTEEPGSSLPQQEMGQYFAKLLAQRRSEPKDDLLTALLAAQVDGQHLTLEELLGFCILLLVAGNVTTTNLIGNAFVSFDEHPAALKQLYADQTLLAGAIEEVLRYRSPVRCMYRVSKETAELGGQRIGPGQFIVSWIGSANRDEAVFPHPDAFDITRMPNRHVGFGHGIHYCLGAPLARLEAKIALGMMLERFSEMHRVSDMPLEPISSVILHGVKHFPLAFKKG